MQIGGRIDNQIGRVEKGYFSSGCLQNQPQMSNKLNSVMGMATPKSLLCDKNLVSKCIYLGNKYLGCHGS